jgi:hypothetical protein
MPRQSPVYTDVPLVPKRETVMIPPLSDFRLAVPEHVVARVVDGTTVLLDIDSGRTFSLDEIGTRAFAVLTESPSAQTALDRLLDEYAAPRQEIERDLIALIDTLVRSNLAHIQSR